MVTRRSLAAGAVALGLFFACSSKAEDGGSCETGSDCSSGTCSAGSCEGADCTCEGADCRARASCQEGWLCTRGDAVLQDAIPRCRKECTGAGQCPSDKHCDNGICKAGPESFSLTWLNIPRTVPCGARVPCEYKVKPSDGVTVASYTWTFGNAPPIETSEPTTSFTYTTTGTADVRVRARATTGGIAELTTKEPLCVGGIDSPCDVLGSLCCQGTCTRGLCK